MIHEFSVQKFTVQPGERLVFRTPVKIKADQRAIVCETIRNAYPGVEFIVIDGTMDISCAVEKSALPPLTESLEA